MPRSETRTRGKHEPKVREFESPTEPERIRITRPTSAVERAFREITEFRNQPSFELSLIKKPT